MLERFTLRKYRTERAREFAHQGFCRRLGTMVRAIDVVFTKLPPELDAVPDRDTVVDATLMIQAFVLNAFGCLDNLAWIWVCEKPVTTAEGGELEPLKVGLGPKNKEVRASFSKEFAAYLAKRQDWVDKHLKGFRDSLAHRIPLYIPPFIITPEVAGEYSRLEKACGEAVQKLNFVLYDKLQAEQRALGIWRPWMTHSVTEMSPRVVFHAQLLQDYVTIVEFGREMLAELDRQKVA
ncbi:hypothetical protein T8J41_15170 [Nitratireductor rhodophyticola]|uniref:hypothetical protein n=1 Tax=Nitratireductor rhodophyticola TaxID=2854036 RepID=UPI002AC89BA5|nr:hypothetical protein [Nitratireductor rhodophyticola]WPZ13480.1 hypothetical protein T8J41_15170 [Nitratireductor rhodophyticola]